MEFAFPHKYIKNTSINGTVLTGYLLNTSRRPWIPKRIGKKKKKNMQQHTMKERSGKGPGPDGELKVRRDSLIQRNTLTVGKSAGRETKLQGIWGECSSLCKERQSKISVCGLCCSLVHPSLSCVSPGMEGAGSWKVEFRGWPRKGIAVACEERTWRDWSKELHNQEILQKKKSHHRSKV